MPIKSVVKLEEKMIYTDCVGIMQLSDFDEYMDEVWSSSDVYGCNELFDTTNADWSQFNFSDLLSIAHKASRLITIDPKSKLAWVIRDEIQEELVGFYKTAKESLPVSSRSMVPFYTKEDALKWINE